MGDWERMFGEAGMSDGFIDSFYEMPNDWVKRMKTLYFSTGEEARRWAKAHPGQVVTRNPKGDGFIANVLEWHDRHSGQSYLDCEKEEFFAWAEENENREKAAGYARECMNFHTNCEAYWLYDNGHREMLLQLYNDYRDRVSLRRYADESRIGKEHRETLRSLLPNPFPEKFRYWPSGKSMRDPQAPTPSIQESHGDTLGEE